MSCALSLQLGGFWRLCKFKAKLSLYSSETLYMPISVAVWVVASLQFVGGALAFARWQGAASSPHLPCVCSPLRAAWEPQQISYIVFWIILNSLNRAHPPGKHRSRPLECNAFASRIKAFSRLLMLIVVPSTEKLAWSKHLYCAINRWNQEWIC